MNKVLTALIFSICLNQHASAQIKVDQTQTASTATQTQKTTTTQPPEIAEANRLSSQVTKLYSQGKYDEALPLAKRALELGEKGAESDQLSIVGHLKNLAEVYIAQKKHSSAEPLYRRALTIYEKKYGKDDLKLCPMLDRLALLHFVAGDLLKVESTYQRVISIKEQALGAESPDVARSLSNLAGFYEIRGEYKKAEPLYRRATAIEEKKPGELSPQSIHTLERYACLLRKLKQPDEADKIETRTIKGNIVDSESEKKTSGDSILKSNSSGDKADVGGGVLNGKAIKKPAPPNPEEAKANRVQGTVTIRIVVDEKGRVVDACAIEGPRLLLQPSENAAYQTVFSPTTLSGQPVKVSGTITFNYTLR